MIYIEADPLRASDPVAYLKRKHLKRFATKENAESLRMEAEELGIPVKILLSNEVAIGEAEVQTAEWLEGK